MRHARILCAGLCVVAAGRLAAQPAPAAPEGAQAVQWLSEPFPPFSFVGPSGPAGVAVDLMKAAQAQANLPEGTPLFLPWARVLQVLAGAAPACVTAMTRTPTREKQHQWVGPFLPADHAVGRRNPAVPWPAGDRPLAGSDVVVIRGDVSEETARALGAEEARIHRVADPVIAARMMLAGRVDGWVYGEAVMRWTLNSLEIPPDRYRFDGQIRGGDNYFSCNAAVGADYLRRLQQGLDAAKKAGKGGASDYDRILARYLRSDTMPPRK
jgi:polar amino acid transport system substrate-binding protein